MSEDELLKEEYFKLQDIIEKFDERTLQIKGWSVTVSLAGMAAALISKDVPPDIKGMAFFLAASASIAFWIIEYFWKRFQWSLLARVKEIEGHFRGTTAACHDPIKPLQINATFGKHIKKIDAKTIRQFFYPFIMLPHLVVAALGMTLATAFWTAEQDGSVGWFGIELVPKPSPSPSPSRTTGN